MKRVLFTVGNPMMGDDAAGALLAGMLDRAPVDGWEVIHGGSAPENVLHRIRDAAPDHVLVVDAADMDLAPGEVRLIPPDRIPDPLLMSTHTLPLSYLMEAIGEFAREVSLLGIQPRLVAFGCPVSVEVHQAVQRIYEGLRGGTPEWELLQPEPEAGEWESP
ncbi:MAG TPA: hydrogenase maturation peptidase HycI [Anaerolineales bacterium]